MSLYIPLLANPTSLSNLIFLPFRRFYLYLHWNIIFHLSLGADSLSLVPQRSSCWETGWASLCLWEAVNPCLWVTWIFFPQFFLLVFKCLYLDPGVFLTFPIPILSWILLWRWAIDWSVLSCWPVSTHHMRKKFDFFFKNSPDMKL